MLRRFVLSLAAAAAVVSVPAVSQAQTVCVGINSCSLNPTASLTIPKVVRLALSSATVTLDTPDFATDSLNAQEPITTVSGINVRSNHPWTIAISSAATDWTYDPGVTGATGGARVRADLLFQVNCAGGTTAVSGTGQTIASGALTNTTNASVCLSTAFPADYASVKNRPGTYTLALTLTLAAN
jgi:hypothetical protein